MRKNICILALANQLGSNVRLVPEEYRHKAGTTKLYSFGPDESVIEMACNLAQRILAQHDMTLDDIDGVFGSSNASFDTLMPSLTTKFASDLGLRDAVSTHVGMGCAGGVQALEACYNKLYVDADKGRKINYLVITADITGRILDPENPKTNIFFSDAVSILLVSNYIEGGYEIEEIGTKSLLSDVNVMHIKNPLYTNEMNKFEMNGYEVFKFAINSFKDILGTVRLSAMIDDCYFVPHQANKRIIDGLIHKGKLDENLVYRRGIENYGNTSGSAVLCGLEDALRREGSFDRAFRVLLGAFGAELSVGGAILDPIDLSNFLLEGEEIWDIETK